MLKCATFPHSLKLLIFLAPPIIFFTLVMTEIEAVTMTRYKNMESKAKIASTCATVCLIPVLAYHRELLHYVHSKNMTDIHAVQLSYAETSHNHLSNKNSQWRERQIKYNDTIMPTIKIHRFSFYSLWKPVILRKTKYFEGVYSNVKVDTFSIRLYTRQDKSFPNWSLFFIIRTWISHSLIIMRT